MDEISVVSARNISYQVGQRFLLREVSFTIKRGERLVVFGMNGSGKTTLMSVLAAYNAPSSGDLKLFGQAVSDDNVIDLRRRIGFVSSSFFSRFYRFEKAADIMLSGLDGSLMPFGACSSSLSLLDEWVKRLHLESLVDKPYCLLSKGEQQKVLLVRALIIEPDLLLLDEPYSGLDIVMRNELEQLLSSLIKERDLTIIQVTHRLEDITDDFPDAILLRDGRIYSKGAVDDVLSPQALEGFLHHDEGSLEIKVDEQVSSYVDLRDNQDHDTDAAVKAGNLVTLGFMGEEVALYGMCWLNEAGQRCVSVSTDEHAMTSFAMRCRRNGVLASSVSYDTQRFDIPLGLQERIQRRMGREIAKKLEALYPDILFDTLLDVRNLLKPSCKVNDFLCAERESLRDLFDEEGLSVFRQHLDDARDRRSISEEQYSLHRAWYEREIRKLREVIPPTQGAYQAFYGFAFERGGRISVAVNANCYEIISMHFRHMAAGEKVSPVIKRMLPDVKDFSRRRALRDAFSDDVSARFSTEAMVCPFEKAPLEAIERMGGGMNRCQEEGYSEATDLLAYYRAKWRL